MTRAGLDYKNPVGESAHGVFKNLCIIERNKSEGSRETERSNGPRSPRAPRSPKSPKPKTKSAHKIMRRWKMRSTMQHICNKIQCYQMVPGWLKVPMSTVKSSTCAEFFSLSPGDRWNKMEKGRICYSCLAPKDVCVNRRCSFEAKVPESLKCQGCSSWSQSKNLAPLSFLFCRRKEHAGLRAPFAEMRKDMEQNLGKLGTMIVDSSIRFVANYMYHVFSMGPGANALGCDQKKFEDKPAPSIDSEIGKINTVDPKKIIHEVSEHSCYLMQTIKIGSSEVLVFFDCSANIHIMDGSLAEKEGLQKVSSNPTSLIVVGGSKVRSNHGTFRFNLGPGDGGEYHEVVCVGMDDVTGGFGTYNLTEICQEYLDQADDDEKDHVLSERVGVLRYTCCWGSRTQKWTQC